MMEITQILATQTDTLNKMRAKSVLALSDSPSADGVNANMIKNSFVQPLWDGEDSIIGEIGRICTQINSVFAKVKTAIEENESSIKTNAEGISTAKTALEKELTNAIQTLTNTINQNKNTANEDIQYIKTNYAKLTDLAVFTYANGRLKITKG